MIFKKEFINTSIALSLLVSTANAISIEEEINSLKFLKEKNLTVSKLKELKSIYQLRLLSNRGEFDAYLTKDKEHIIFGTVINTKTNKELFFETDMKNYDEFQAFEYGTGKEEYYVFTDPECHFCKNFENQWGSLKDKVKFHVFLFPLSFHKNANNMSLYILNQKNDTEKALALHNIDKDKKYETVKDFTLKEKQKLTDKLNKQLSIAKELSVSGTPAMFDKNGKKIQWNILVEKYKVKSVDKKMLVQLEKTNAFIKYGKGKKKLYLFTDVDCPFCRKEFTSGKLDKLAKDHTIYIFLHPLKQLHPKSLAKSLFILSKESNKERIEQLKRFFKGSSLLEKEIQIVKDMTNSKLKKQNKAVQQMSIVEYMTSRAGINSTPSMYNEDGKKIH